MQAYQLHDPHSLFQRTILHSLLLLQYEWTGFTREGKRIEMELKSR